MTTTAKKQSKSELRRMATFYKAHYDQVYFINCLNCGRTIGVETLPAEPGKNLVTDRGRNLFTYQDLCLSVRQRMDTTPDNQKMIGYECVCGNSTILAEVERGEVQQSTHITDKDGNVVAAGDPIRSLSPFEKNQIEATVSLKQSGSRKKADYEANDKVERFESFELERIA